MLTEGKQLWKRVLHWLGFNAYWYYAEAKIAFLSGMEDAGWIPK